LVRRDETSALIFSFLSQFVVRKKRFFILRSDIRELCYYVSEDQLTLIGSIAIDANTIVWNVTEQETTDPMNKNSFVVRWHAPTDSQKVNRDVMLKSEDVITMNEWLDAISSEALRTEEVKKVDWWLELFGRVRTPPYGSSLALSSSLTDQSSRLQSN
jgi:hypothetical protein